MRDELQAPPTVNAGAADNLEPTAGFEEQEKHCTVTTERSVGSRAEASRAIDAWVDE